MLAIDGGNSKTDVVLVDEKGTVLASARAGGFTPQASGVAAAVAVAAGAVARVRAELGVPDGVRLARHLSAYVAGADLEIEEEALALAFAAENWAETVEVGNDTFALLRAGATRPWGVAVVCGAGVNACGIGPDGRRARFPALGRLTGDWGGGHYLGEEALWYAIRGEDGRGPKTALTEAVAEHFSRATVEQVAIAIHLGEIDNERLNELSPVLMRVATEGDGVALKLVDRMAEEVVTMARVALSRLGIERTDAEVVLGGGVLRARPPVLMGRIAAQAGTQIPRAELIVAADPPVLGAALLGLDALGLTPR
ncbi:MAG TPA: BadF/BadG/BcrA/BcrD ATPase family protein [Actinocrinis sp.]|nr:BadF/BadG/BcrA/BcrD ATPase family protein [Actinocrinis sp.]